MVLIVFADRSVPTYIYDGALVMGNMLNAAHSEGLGSCWVHRAKEMFESKEGKALLGEWGLREELEGIGCCVLGYSSDEELPPARPRKKDYIIYV